MSKNTSHGSKRKRANKHGFLSRKDSGVLKNRRQKGRKTLAKTASKQCK